MHVLHAERGLDDHLETDALLAAHGGLALRHQHVDGIDIRGGADLGDHDEVEALPALLHDIDHVAIHEMGVEAVDAHRERLAAPVDVAQRLDDVLARLGLVVGGDGVLEVEEDDVGRGFGSLFKELRLTAGDGQLAAVEAGRRLLDDLEAHGAGSVQERAATG
jgi:hypothetical protein